MMGDGVVAKVIELFGRSATELTRGVIVIGFSLKAQVEMMEVLVGVLAKAEDVMYRERASEIVAGLSENCADMYSDKKEN